MRGARKIDLTQGSSHCQDWDGNRIEGGYSCWLTGIAMQQNWRSHLS